MPERTYTEKEVAAILARAAERERPASSGDSSVGLTLAEIEHAGHEAGMDPSAVRAAAAELDSQHRYPKRSNISVAERWVETPIEVGAWEDLVASLRHRFGSNAAWGGKDTAALGTAQEWRHTSTSGISTTVMLSPREGRSLLRVVQEEAGFENARIMGWVLAVLLAALPSMLAGALVAETLGWGDVAGVATVMLVMLTVVSISGPRLAARVQNGRERQAEDVEAIVDDLVDQLGGGHSPRRADASSKAVEPSLDRSALERLAPEADIQPEGRRVKQ